VNAATPTEGLCFYLTLYHFILSNILYILFSVNYNDYDVVIPFIQAKMSFTMLAMAHGFLTKWNSAKGNVRVSEGIRTTDWPTQTVGIFVFLVDLSDVIPIIV